jgi:hypothetical protein
VLIKPVLPPHFLADVRTRIGPADAEPAAAE